jgi:protocatechuate 3,4-dioxygenase beta subunit
MIIGDLSRFPVSRSNPSIWWINAEACYTSRRYSRRKRGVRERRRRRARIFAQRMRWCNKIWYFKQQFKQCQLFKFVRSSHKRYPWPYFVDDRSDPNISNDNVDSSIPQRSDIRSDAKGGTGTQSGLPLYLNITVGDYSSGACSPISNAQVHIWHCNAQGEYSDVQAGGTDLTGENFLRGYVWTDASGLASFTTIYPGWYSGRAVHIHVKVRVFDSSGNVTTEATTQLFFDDSTTDSVYSANSAYSRSGSRDTLNTNDNIYESENPSLLVSLSGSATTNYTGTVSIGITEGSIFGG